MNTTTLPDDFHDLLVALTDAGVEFLDVHTGERQRCRSRSCSAFHRLPTRNRGPHSRQKQIARKAANESPIPLAR